ncbi:MAG: U32 family peptidase [Prevotellaceae bacterium]|jgi:putative protease|nr:U32 family peptidase [Prevotellaceae bacterium]
MSQNQQKIELISPAKDSETGIAAILQGADAVYIGAPKFSARSAASNSVEDIEELVSFAHRYFAKVYVALNTILKDSELAETQQLIYDLYKIGVDALIIQDMGILELDLPPIELHASTQCNNRTVEKVNFLEKCGFSQVVLARELSLEQIMEIRRKTSVRLECFVQGALCVSYSGQCYASAAVAGRSANRGECAQMCRLPYSLIEANGRQVAENQHLLSLKDLSAADYLEKMIDIGITSFKIEGRLKNVDYVKNVTAFYRKKLDEILQKKSLFKTSSGNVKLNFMPNLQKTFYRGETSYFLEKREKNIVEPRTPKSTGEPIGKVILLNINNLVIKTDVEINNGDGLCAFDRNGNLAGFRVNRVEGNRIFPKTMPKIEKGALVYRNFDIKFSKILENVSAERKIAVKIEVFDNLHKGLIFKITDENNRCAEVSLQTELTPAQNPEKSRETLENTLKKLGDTIFELVDIKINTSENWFIPVSKIAQVKRILVEKLLTERQKTAPKNETTFCKTSHIFPEQSVDYHANIYNQKAKEFYQRHCVSEIAPAFEQFAPHPAEIMRSKHCIKFSLNLCPKQKPDKQTVEPFYLVRGNNKFLLKFDCKNCEMSVILE